MTQLMTKKKKRLKKPKMSGNTSFRAAAIDVKT